MVGFVGEGPLFRGVVTGIGVGEGPPFRGVVTGIGVGEGPPFRGAVTGIGVVVALAGLAVSSRYITACLAQCESGFEHMPLPTLVSNL